MAIDEFVKKAAQVSICVILSSCASETTNISANVARVDDASKITYPDYEHFPTNRFSFESAKAQSANISGYGIVKCKLQTDHHPKGCSILDEYPLGFGFGVSAIKVAESTLMQPATKNGEPFAMDVTIPVMFNSYCERNLRGNNPTKSNGVLLCGIH